MKQRQHRIELYEKQHMEWIVCTKSIKGEVSRSMNIQSPHWMLSPKRASLFDGRWLKTVVHEIVSYIGEPSLPAAASLDRACGFARLALSAHFVELPGKQHYARLIRLS